MKVLENSWNVCECSRLRIQVTENTLFLSSELSNSSIQACMLLTLLETRISASASCLNCYY
ncbi:hypothetical protein SOVF_043440 isoform B [Spinacia oleracea]|nr:hypothetical protein SOVF_043440 isoform B [Spinacia oleracea]